MALFPNFKHGRHSVNGTEIAYVIDGVGPPVLMLHGYPQTMAMWARVAPLLAVDYTVVCADLRGYGASGKPSESEKRDTYSFREMGKDQVGLMAALGFETFTLVGHDRGARVAHRIALDRPEVLTSLVLMDIVPTFSMYMKMNQEIARKYWHWLFLAHPGTLAEEMIGANPDLFFSTFVQGLGGVQAQGFDPEMLAAYQGAWRNPEMIRGSCADYRAAAGIDLKHDFTSIDQPIAARTLVMYAEDGVLASMIDVEAEWLEWCPNPSFARVRGGHYFVDLYPEETAEALRSFIG